MFSAAKQILSVHILTVLFAVAFLTPVAVQASTYTNENFLFSYHYQPVTFSLLVNGGFTGTLANGSTFKQVPILTESSIRLHKFTIDDAHFYVSDQGTFQASSNLIALSIYSYLATT